MAVCVQGRAFAQLVRHMATGQLKVLFCVLALRGDRIRAVGGRVVLESEIVAIAIVVDAAGTGRTDDSRNRRQIVVVGAMGWCARVDEYSFTDGHTVRLRARAVRVVVNALLHSGVYLCTKSSHRGKKDCPH